MKPGALIVLVMMLACPDQVLAQSTDFRVRSLTQIQHLAALQSNTAEHSPDQVVPNLGELTLDARKSYRWEGAVVGGVLGGVALTYVGLRVCEEDCVLAGGKAFVGGAVLGGFVGALVGGAFPKGPR